MEMTAPMTVARPGIDRPHLRDDQLHALRGSLIDALAEQRQQHDHNDALFHVILAAGADAETSHDRELIRIAADRARDAVDEIEDAIHRLAMGTYGTCESC